MRHFYVGIKFFQFVENGVLVIVFKIIVALLNEGKVRSHQRESNTHLWLRGRIDKHLELTKGDGILVVVLKKIKLKRMYARKYRRTDHDGRGRVLEVT